MSHPDHQGSAGASLSIARVQPYERRGLALASSALDLDGRLLDIYSADHDDLVPGLSWSAVLEADSYALIVEDPDAPRAEPFIHWLLWNIPGKAIELQPGLTRAPHPKDLPGAVQGLNSAGGVGWRGPQPPPGDGPHRYHFQLFALSASLAHLSPTTSLAELVDALKGITIASGELVGLYEVKDPSSPDAPQPHRTRDQGRGGLDEDDLDRHAPHSPDGAVRPA